MKPPVISVGTRRYTLRALVYSFYVNVADSPPAGSLSECDRVHVIADPYSSSGISGVNYASDYPEDGSYHPWLVATDSTNNILLPPVTSPNSVWGYFYFYDGILTVHAGANSFEYSPDAPTFYSINTAHGTLSSDPTTGNLIYTPTPGYRGLDSFTYECTYNWHSEDATCTLTTNTATYAIQVGNWLDLSPQISFPGTDGPVSVLAAGASENATLTLQNPRPTASLPSVAGASTSTATSFAFTPPTERRFCRTPTGFRPQDTRRAAGSWTWSRIMKIRSS